MDPQLVVDAVAGPAIPFEAMKGTGVAGGVSLVLNGIMSMALNPKLEVVWKRQRWFVRPGLLLLATIGAGFAGSLLTGLDVRAAALSCFVGMAASLTGPTWKMIFEKATDDLVEEVSGPHARPGFVDDDKTPTAGN